MTDLDTTEFLYANTLRLGKLHTNILRLRMRKMRRIIVMVGRGVAGRRCGFLALTRDRCISDQRAQRLILFS